MYNEAWHPLDSSNLSAYSYDPASGRLSIRFNSGKTYDFAEVPQSIADGLSSAASPGQYFNSAIKNQYRQAWQFKK